MDHITSSPAVVPLIGIIGSREQSFTAVDVLTAEAAIRETLADRLQEFRVEMSTNAA